MRLLLLLFVLSLPACALAQNDCDLGQVTDSTPLVYPPIARAAHVSGLVLLRVSFKSTGEADHIEVLSGPEMLKQSATSYVQGWKSSPYPGIRNCPIAIDYKLDRPDSQWPGTIKRIDAQRVEISSYMPCLCDPGAALGGGSFWYRLKRLFHRH